MTAMIIKEVSSKKEIEDLRKKSAFTIEGLLLTQENSGDLIDWFAQNDALVEEQVEAHIITGELMNKAYELTKTNRYPSEISIVAFTNIDQMNLITARFSVGGRWLDDIIENNINREK